ncbi:hypothetical protein FRC10_005635 [Ceratobasidium sp. 414]|nr:hypothetical protein FRC10_005635 [Ceratobasidium sp. 414]
MHAFELLIMLNAPFQGAEFDQRPVVWRLFAAVIEQINESDACRAVARSHADWVPANFDALRVVVDHYDIHYDDLSLLDLMPAFEKVMLMQYIIDYFVELVKDGDRAKLSETSKLVQMLVPLTVLQIEREVDSYLKAEEGGKGYELSEAAKMELRDKRWKAKTARWGAVGRLMRKVIMVKV